MRINADMPLVDTLSASTTETAQQKGEDLLHVVTVLGYLRGPRQSMGYNAMCMSWTAIA